MTTKEGNDSEKAHRRVAWVVLSILLFLRIPYTILIIYFLPIENQMGAAIYETSTYLLTAILIWWERDRLIDFHIDTLSLLLIIFARPLQTLILLEWKVDSPLVPPQPMGFLIWLVSFVLIISLWKSGFRPGRISRQNWIAIAIGLFIGIGVSVLENLDVFVSSFGNSSRVVSTPQLSSSALVLLYHVGFAPINEEPLFRGFLWGYLRQLKWKETGILFFQAALFTSAHVYFASQYPLRFWLFIPCVAILLGLLTWRTRSIAPAILTHGAINGSVYVLILNLMDIL